MKVKSESEVAQSCPTLSDPMDCSLPGSSIHGIFQARVLEWLKPFIYCFPDSSTGEVSACNAGEPGSIAELGRSTGEGIGYLLQYSWASLVAQKLKRLPIMQETRVRSLGREDTLEKGMAAYSNILAWILQCCF